MKFNLTFYFKDGTDMKAKPGAYFTNLSQTFIEIEQNIRSNRHIIGVNEQGEEFKKYYKDIKSISIDF